VLIGPPGAGKSTVGRALAGRLGRPFVDLDEEIARREGAAVTTLFAAHGERYFRLRERDLTAELATRDEPLVIATGGGWVTNEGVVSLLRKRGRIILLATSAERAMARLAGASADRPLLAGPDPLGALRMLLRGRQSLYERAADVVVSTDLLTVQQVTDKLVELASTPGEG
jgi:shikimate kinase